MGQTLTTTHAKIIVAKLLNMAKAMMTVWPNVVE